MAVVIEEIGRFCRFCLRRDGLMALSEATSSSFSIADAHHYTGIELSEDDGNASYSVCLECCLTIKNSVCFRRACLNNDVTFKKLVAVLQARIKPKVEKNESGTADDLIVINSDSEDSAEENQFVQSMETDALIEAIDDSDLDSPTPPSLNESAMRQISDEFKSSSGNGGKVQPANIADAERQKGNTVWSNPNPNPYSMRPISDEVRISSGYVAEVQPTSIVGEEKQKENIVYHIPPNINTFDGSETCDFMPTLDGEVNCLVSGSKEAQKDDVDASEELNLIQLDDSDSNDSLPSLYGEVMRKAIEEERAKPIVVKPIITTIVDTNVEPKPKYQIVKDRHVCHICGGLYVEITHHVIRAHGTEKRFICSHCQKKFASRFALKRHINTWHEKRIILTCEHCGKGFVNHSSHFYHMKNSHGESDIYECETCPRKFKSIDGYRKHLKEHSIASYPCPHCDKLFKTTVTLEKHQLRYHAS